MKTFLLIFFSVGLFLTSSATASHSFYGIQSTTELFKGKYNLYEFKAPKGLFKRVGKDTYYCSLYKAYIKFHLNITYRMDETGFYKKSDLIKYYKNGVQTTLLTDKADWFVLSGYTKNRDIVYFKGFYEELRSMQGREKGTPDWMWSRSGVIEILYPEKFRKEIDPIVSIVNKSFKFDVYATFELEMNP
jgi:hypothetical protein